MRTVEETEPKKRIMAEKTRNWKTTLTGVLMIVGVIAGAGTEFLKSGTVSNLEAYGAALVAGWGFIVASDSK